MALSGLALVLLLRIRGMPLARYAHPTRRVGGVPWVQSNRAWGE